MPILHTCTAGVQDGVARCRKSVISDPTAPRKDRCDLHQGTGWASAPAPTTVLVKVNVNPTWWELLHRAGVRTFVRTFARAEQLEQKHVAEATSLGRNAYASRDQRDHKQTPESAASGCPVFGKPGLADAAMDIRGLVRELFAAGFVLSAAHLLERNHKPPVRLVMEFSKPSQKPAMVNFPWKAFQQLVATSFGQIDVWANLKQADGNVVHTVNCGKREDTAKPQNALHFAGGDWSVEAIDAPHPVVLAAEAVAAA